MKILKDFYKGLDKFTHEFFRKEGPRKYTKKAIENFKAVDVEKKDNTIIKAAIAALVVFGVIAAVTCPFLGPLGLAIGLGAGLLVGGAVFLYKSHELEIPADLKAKRLQQALMSGGRNLAVAGKRRLGFRG